MHHHIDLKKGLRTSSNATCDVLFEFWAKANIPVRAKQHVITKIEKVFAQWKALRKHSNRTTPGYKKQEADFLINLKSLFDITHEDAIDKMNIQEDKDFLIAQREEGRLGTLGQLIITF